jgi:sigma-B regulation protein RsbU (phosphoserine phosphatase)
VCDVVGKGVRASLLMASVRASLRAHARNVYHLSEVLAEVNRDLCADTLTSDFATLFYGVIDLTTRRLTYANAGHVQPLLIRDGEIQRLSTGGGVLGVDDEATWDNDVVSLQSGDVVMAYTDGLSEAMNFDDVAFGTHRVERAALAAAGQDHSADGIVKHVLWEMRRFAGLQKRFDDLSVVVIRVL